MEINEATARKVLATVDAGLVSGMGAPRLGAMCVEAADAVLLEFAERVVQILIDLKVPGCAWLPLTEEG